MRGIWKILIISIYCSNAQIWLLRIYAAKANLINDKQLEALKQACGRKLKLMTRLGPNNADDNFAENSCSKNWSVGFGYDRNLED